MLRQVLFLKFMPGGSKQKKKATNKLIELVRAFGRTLAEKRAIGGRGLDLDEGELMEPTTHGTGKSMP